jgi:NADH:ubiquinone oxidoreductase subunit 6 (subunit J)
MIQTFAFYMFALLLLTAGGLVILSRATRSMPCCG